VRIGDSARVGDAVIGEQIDRSGAFRPAGAIGVMRQAGT
jgi:hypothetical protein